MLLENEMVSCCLKMNYRGLEIVSKTNFNKIIRITWWDTGGCGQKGRMLLENEIIGLLLENEPWRI